MDNPYPVILTPRAGAYLANFMKKQGKSSYGLHVEVRQTGCLGLAYFTEYAETPQEGDQAYTSEGIHLFVDKSSLPYIMGSSIDYTRVKMNQTLKFNNPLEKESCICGNTFRV